MSRKRSSKPDPRSSIEAQLQQISQLGQAGQLAEAAQRCCQLGKRYPRQASIWHLLSVIELQRNEPKQALTHIQRAIELEPKTADFHSHAGVVYCHLNAFMAGIAAYQQALSLQPATPSLHTRFNLGLAWQKLGQLDVAEQTYLQLIADRPDYAATYQQLGNLHQQQSRLPTAIFYYRQALQLQPQEAATWCNFGVALQAIGEIKQAQAAFEQALALSPDSIEALNGLGAVFETQEQATQAMHCYQRVLTLQPSYLPALTNLGNLQLRLERFAAAQTTFDQILHHQPQSLPALENYAKLLLATCNWSNLSEITARIRQQVQICLAENLPIDCSPLLSLLLPFSAAEQQVIARHYAESIQRRMSMTTDFKPVQKPRIRLGYISGDFRYHAVGQLILRLFELHNRQTFEVYAYSFSPIDGSAEQQKLRQDCDCFRDLRGCSPMAAVQQVQQDEIDILIDLAGYTNYACPELLALRPAPLQINYLGYPATMGAAFIDYIITDSVITPPELAATLTETCIYLPDTYQVNCYPYPDASDQAIEPRDSVAPAPQLQASSQLKQENGLPIDAFVFCCFNKSQKLEPTMFAVWLRILQQVPNSVLWLLSDRPETEQNLRSQAAPLIDADRLIFAPRVNKEVHLSRHLCADLFLDTRYYNAHVTASDALWAGTPVLTLLGETFASRVAASLLTAAGLPELITTDLSAYETLAVHLATRPVELQQLKKRLSQARSQSKLFNTEQTVRHLEVAYQQVWQRYQAGGAAEPIQVKSAVASISTFLSAESNFSNPDSTNSEEVSGLRTPETETEAMETGFVTTGPVTTRPVITETTKTETGIAGPVATGPVTTEIGTTEAVSHLEAISCVPDAGFVRWLQQAQGSLLITTYQANKVLIVGWNGKQVTLLARQFSKPMGIALSDDRIALSTRHELIVFANARSLAHDYRPDQLGRYDALYLPRSSYFTGDLHTHDLAFGESGLWLVNTRFSCLAQLSLDFSFVPRWYPAFISEIVPEDRCHLNGLAMVNGQPKYVTALEESDTVGGWRSNKAQGGIVIDVETDQIVLQGLSMPHSPRWHQDKLWLLNSGTGELWCIEPHNWRHEVVCALPGFGRGLALIGNYALIGLCQIREQHIFGGLPIQERFDSLICGVAIVDLKRRQPIGLLKFPTGCRELYDVKFLPDLLRPNLLHPDQPATRSAFTAPEFAYWLRPANRVEEPPASNLTEA